jgi:hypothetical protein
MGSRGTNSYGTTLKNELRGSVHNTPELFPLDNGLNHLEIQPEIFKPCACCGVKTIPEGSNHYVCKICGWTDDEIQNSNPDYVQGINKISLNDAKKSWAKGETVK